MTRFKNRKGIVINQYTIGEKILYYSKRINNQNLTPNQKKYALGKLKKLNNYTKNRTAINEIFIASNKISEVTKKKGHRVLVIDLKKDKAALLQVQRKKGYVGKNVMNLSHFDGEHELDLRPYKLKKEDEICSHLVNDLYEKSTFYGTENDFLTEKEKLEVQRKYKR